MAWMHLMRWKRANLDKIEIKNIVDLHGGLFSSLFANDHGDDYTYFIVYYRWLLQEEPKPKLGLFTRLADAVFPLTAAEEAELSKLGWPRRIFDAIFPMA